MNSYSQEFFQSIEDWSHRPAQEIIPLVLEMVQPSSVIDVGCGTGIWLSVVMEHGINNVFGVDGDYVDRRLLQIPDDRFLAWDLKQPIALGRIFDLVIALEVGEHLPSDCAESFVDSLTRLGPVVLFSAAIPFQGGTSHLNEQWPAYWVERFQARDFVVIDCIRKRIWENPNVAWFYAQNMLLFVKQGYLGNVPLLENEYRNTVTAQLSLIHPKKYLHLVYETRQMRNLLLATQDLASLLPSGETTILVDQGELDVVVTAGHHAVPFLERDGQYWGPPPDDETAIREFERLRQAGATFMVFAWPAFWWLEYYRGLHHHLRSNFRCVLENDRLVVFDLRHDVSG